MKDERIQAKPKRVIIHHEFADECGVGSHAILKWQFNDLIDHIENGHELPGEYYRLGIGKTPDLLLQMTGVKHLHLGGPGSDILVYLLELHEEVWILRIAGHYYMEDTPRGVTLFEKMGLPHPSQKR